MNFRWLKRYMPRGLYGRAALILILPVVTLQLVVSVVFIQRHFEGVTVQLTSDVARSLNLVLQTEDPVVQRELATALAFDIIEVDPAAVPSTDLRRWYDFSGIVVTSELRRKVDGLLQVQLPNDWDVNLFIPARDGIVVVRFDRTRASASNPHQLLVNMVVFGGFMTIIAYIYLRNQLRPITQLARASEAFGRGRLVPYSPAGALEVRAAGSAFLDMRSRIERQIEQRTMMLSGVSHDLRTPLTRLRLGLSMLESEDREDLERDVDDMQNLLDAFLEFARGDAEPGVAEKIDPIQFMTAIVEDAQRGGKPVTLGEMSGSGDIELRPLALRRATENLIGNAVRYGEHCRVSVKSSPRSLRIRIEDDGPGIPAEKREDAIKPFVRLDPARNQNKGPGVGLGLAIAADIARRHGGVLRLGVSDDMGGLCADIVFAR